MPVGRVKWYDKMKGYGFIENAEGDVFFHFSDIQMDGFKALAEDQRVDYELLHSERGLKAKKIRPLDNRATTRRAARYRTLMLMKIKDGKIKDFSDYISHIPSWYDRMEQDLGLRRIGTWLNGNSAVHLVESDKPYEQSMSEAREHQDWGEFIEWQNGLEMLLDGKPSIMSPTNAQATNPPEERGNNPA